MQPSKGVKPKYLKPQVFSVSGAVRSTNPTHCRSLVDLNSYDTTSAEKENINNDHFSSIVSNQEQRNVDLKAPNKMNGTNKNIPKQTLANYGNISNIAKILMNGNHTQKAKNSQNTVRMAIYKDASNRTSNSNLNSLGRKNQILNSDANLKQRQEVRNSSQASNNEGNQNGSIPKQVMKYQITSLQKQRSEKNFQKQSQQMVNSKAQKQEKQQTVNNSMDYSLLVKLKQYIEELKQTQSTQVQQIQELRKKNKQLEQQLVFAKDKAHVYQIRQKQMMKKIKYLEVQINKLTYQLGKRSEKYQNKEKGECEEHLLIIQSLRNVINEQMAKIIQMETYKVQLQQHKLKNNSYTKKYVDVDMSQRDQEAKKSKFEQVYSFKKQSKLSQSSIYIEDEEDKNQGSLPINYSQIQNNTKKTNSHSKYSQSTIPEPYNQLMKCLKSDLRPKSSCHNRFHKQYKQSSEVSDSLRDSGVLGKQEESREMQKKLNDYEKQLDRFKQQCSQDQILQQVGQYLQNIRRNIRDN